MTGGYSSYKSIIIKNKACDLLSINYGCFVSCLFEKKEVLFFNIQNLKIDKIISNIDVVDSDNCLSLFDNYIIINCIKGIGIISINTKEIIQYIFNYFGYETKNISIFKNKVVFLASFSGSLKIMKLIYKDGFLIPVLEYNNISLITKKKKISINEYELIPFFGYNFIIYERNIYLLT